MENSFEFYLIVFIDKGIYQWDTKSGKLIQKLHGHNDKVTSLKYLDITSLISGSHDRKLQIWDLNKGCIINSLSSCGSRVNDICTTPYGFFNSLFSWIKSNSIVIDSI